MGALLLAAAPFALAHNPSGTPRNYCEDPSEWNSHDYGQANGFTWLLQQDGNFQGDCNGDTIPADFDGHTEFAFGGAWILVDSGDGVTGGTIACYGEVGHHPRFGPFTVVDLVFGTTVSFNVYSDTINLVPPTDPAAPNCGDFEPDQWSSCSWSPCFVTFPPGPDGSYQVAAGEVFTAGAATVGHIYSP